MSTASIFSEEVSYNLQSHKENLEWLDIDDSFVKIVGGFGRYQILMTFLLSLLAIPLAGLIALPVFTTANITELQHYNYRVKNDSSILYEWNLFDKMWLSDLIQAMYFTGFLVGVVVLGQLSDRFGRRIVLRVGLVLLFIVSLGTSFSISVEMFTVFRFFTGFLAGGGNTVLFVLMQEQIGSNWWAVSSAMHGIFYSCGFIVYSGLSYYIPAWRRLVQVLAILQIPSLLFAFFLKSSPRWLYSKNRAEEAEKVLLFIAQKNGVKNPVINLKPMVAENTERNPSLLAVIKHRITLKRLIILSFVWFVVSFLYYALILAAGDLDSNVYVSESLSGLVDIASDLIYPWLLSRKWAGRKRTISVAFVIAGSACLSLMAFKSSDASKAKVVLGLVGKLFASLSFSSLYVYTPELFPTYVRNVTLGAVSMVARLGGILSSFANSFIQLYPLYSYLSFGVCGLSAGVLTLFLPETLGKKPPNSFQELHYQAPAYQVDPDNMTNAQKCEVDEKTPLLEEDDKIVAT